MSFVLWIALRSILWFIRKTLWRGCWLLSELELKQWNNLWTFLWVMSWKWLNFFFLENIFHGNFLGGFEFGNGSGYGPDYKMLDQNSFFLQIVCLTTNKFPKSSWFNFWIFFYRYFFFKFLRSLEFLKFKNFWSSKVLANFLNNFQILSRLRAHMKQWNEKTWVLRMKFFVR